MRLRSSAAGAAVAGGLLSVVLASPALAVCDAYSGTCTEPPGVLPSTLTSTPPEQTTEVATTTQTSPSTLPFTGAELVLVSVVGLGAVAGGAVLVAAGRRRAGSTSS